MFNVEEILDRLNYPIHIRGRNCVCDTSFRGGDSKSLYVNENGTCHDLVQNRTFPLVELVQNILGGTLLEAQKFIGSNQEAAPIEKEVKLKVEKNFDPQVIHELTKSYKFYLDKGIRKEVLEEFGGGLCHGGKMYLRFCFPIYNKQKKINGVAGRCVRFTSQEEKQFGKDRPFPKWKILGEKKNFLYPLFISSPFIQESRQIVLVESIGDCLSLWNSGIKNVFCLFGVALSDPALIAIAAEAPKEILLALNNDSESDRNRGVEGAAKVRAKLNKLFSLSSIRDAFPEKNDFGAQSVEENLNWAKKNRVKIYGEECKKI